MIGHFCDCYSLGVILVGHLWDSFSEQWYFIEAFCQIFYDTIHWRVLTWNLVKLFYFD